MEKQVLCEWRKVSIENLHFLIKKNRMRCTYFFFRRFNFHADADKMWMSLKHGKRLALRNSLIELSVYRTDRCEIWNDWNFFKNWIKERDGLLLMKNRRSTQLHCFTFLEVWRQTHSQTGWQTDWQTGRHTDTDRQTGRQTHLQRKWISGLKKHSAEIS